MACWTAKIKVERFDSKNCQLKIFLKILVLEASEPLSFSLPGTAHSASPTPTWPETLPLDENFGLQTAFKKLFNFSFEKSLKNVPESTILDPKIVPTSKFFRLFFESVDFSKVVLSSGRELNFQGSGPPKNDSKSMPKSRSKINLKKTSQESIFGSSWRVLGLQLGAKLG